jgi:hypothetical protein
METENKRNCDDLPRNQKRSGIRFRPENGSILEPTMSKHHHHPNEGHGEGSPPRSMRNHLHHNWFFYVSGIFILVALLAFVLSGNLSWQFSAAPSASTPLISGKK